MAATQPLNAATLREIDGLYRRLIELRTATTSKLFAPGLGIARYVVRRQDRHAGRRQLAGFWGTDVVMQHFHDLYAGTFVMAPDYARVKTVGLSHDVGTDLCAT